MGQIESLIALLGALYLSDCWFVVAHSAVLFRSPLLRGWTSRRGPVSFTTSTSAWILLRVLPPLGRHLVCEPWPIAVTPHFVVTRAAPRALGGGTLTLRPVAIEAMAEARADGKQILAGRSVVARASSVPMAKGMASLLRELAAMKASQREQHIARSLSKSFQVEEIERRRDELLRASAPLATACNCLFGYLIAVVPLCLYTLGLTRSWMALLAILVAFQVWVVFAFVRAHRQLFPDAAGQRREHLFQMSISPPIAVRALDALCRDVMADFHPLAVAKVLTSEPEFQAFARTFLRESRFGSARRAWPEEVRGVREWFDPLEFEELSKLVASAGDSPDKWVAAPDPETGSLAYCPLCHTQFTRGDGLCDDCDGMPLVPFAAATSAPG
ncbi:MAG TPA: hypothetical protein VK843_11180 [Planctomycetota bacterium]|nr:hypothetical protein [Planctomycetota bacterium]